jgi:hypothetical protein
MKKYATMAMAAVVFLLYAFTAAAINLKPDKPQEHTGSLTVEHSGKKKKVEGARLVVSREQIRILPGKKSGVASRTVTAKGADKYVDEKGQPVSVKVLDKNKGLTFKFSNGAVCTFLKRDP